MKIKFNLKNHIAHRIYIYLIILVALPIIVSSAILLKTNPKATEKYSLFVGAYLKPESTLKVKVTKYLKEFDNKEINIFAMDYYDSSFNLHYAAQGMNSDAYILPLKAMQEMDKSVLAILEEGNEFYSSTNYIDEDGHHYGIEIINQFNDDIRYQDEKYYVCVRKDSVHSLRFNESAKDEQTYVLLKGMFNEE